MSENILTTDFANDAANVTAKSSCTSIAMRTFLTFFTAASLMGCHEIKRAIRGSNNANDIVGSEGKPITTTQLPGDTKRMLKPQKNGRSATSQFTTNGRYNPL